MVKKKNLPDPARPPSCKESACGCQLNSGLELIGSEIILASEYAGEIGREGCAIAVALAMPRIRGDLSNLRRINLNARKVANSLKYRMGMTMLL